MQKKKLLETALNYMNISSPEIKLDFIKSFSRVGHKLHICSICNKMIASGYMHKETGRVYCGLNCLNVEYGSNVDLSDLFECEILEFI